MKQMMLKMAVRLTNLFRREEGQGMVEYGLIIGLVAVVLIVAITALTGGLEGIFGAVTDELEAAITATP